MLLQDGSQVGRETGSTMNHTDLREEFLVFLYCSIATTRSSSVVASSLMENLVEKHIADHFFNFRDEERMGLFEYGDEM